MSERGLAMDTKKVGQLIAECRKKKGITQKELAETLGVTNRAVSKWETGVGLPDISALPDLAAVLGITVDELLNGQRIREKKKAVKESIVYDEATVSYRKLAEHYNNKIKEKSDGTALFAAWLFGIAIFFLNDFSRESLFPAMMLSTGIVLVIGAIVYIFYYKKKKFVLDKLQSFRYLELEVKEEKFSVKDLKTNEIEYYAVEVVEENDEEFCIDHELTFLKQHMKQADVLWLREILGERVYLQYVNNCSEVEVAVELIKECEEKISDKLIVQDISESVSIRNYLKKKNDTQLSYGAQTFCGVVFSYCVMQIFLKSSWNFIFIILAILVLMILFYQEWTNMLLIILRKVLRKRRGLQKVIIDEDGLLIKDNLQEKLYLWNEFNYVMESDEFIRLDNVALLYKSSYSRETVKQAKRILKEKLNDKYTMYRSLERPGIWRKIGFALCIILLVAVVAFSKNGIENVVETEEQNQGPNVFTDILEDMPIGATVINNGMFCEKVHDKEQLHLADEELELSELYFTNLTNENTHIQIRQGVLYAESYNESGQLGLGDKEYHYNAKGYFIPYEIDSDVLSAGIGKTFITYLKSDGTLYVIGEMKGQVEMPVPTQVLTDVAYMDCGQEYILALKYDGSVWILGQQIAEAEEKRDYVKYKEFTKIFDDAIYISAGRYTSAVILKDNSLWIWGDNSHGQCGAEANEMYYFAENALRMAGEYKMVWMDLPEINSRHTYITDPSLAENSLNNFVLNNYRTYVQKMDSSLWVCGEKVIEDIFMPLELY